MLNKIRTHYLYIVLGLLAIILAVTSLLPFPIIADTGLKSLLVELAIGLFIAIVLSMTVERYASDQFRQEVDEALQKTRVSVLEATFSTLIPPEIYDELRSLILTRPFIRRDVMCYVSLEWPLDESKDCFKLQTRFSYNVQNITNLNQGYTVFAEIERPINPKFRDQIKFDNFVIGNTNYKGDELLFIARGEERRLFIREEITIRPDEPVTISMQDTRFEDAVGDYSILMGLPTIGFTLMVSHPLGVKVEAVERHPNAERLIKIEGTDTLSGWKLEGGILPYQGIKINWYPITEYNNGSSITVR
jgi:hypothetical protein